MTRKELNAQKAQEWLNEINHNKTWMSLINKSISSAVIRTGDLVSKSDISFVSMRSFADRPISVECTSENTYTALKRIWSEGNINVGILNFASYFNPGGGFIKGAGTQEESLCHVSGLYPILNNLEVYKLRRRNKCVSSLYEDEVIYTSNVPFTEFDGNIGTPIMADVISVAAPNMNRVAAEDMDKYHKAIKNRVEAIMCLPYINGCEVLVLGAWGCGVFKNNPEVIATAFCEAISKYGRAYKHIVFPLPNAKMKEVFEERLKFE